MKQADLSNVRELVEVDWKAVATDAQRDKEFLRQAVVLLAGEVCDGRTVARCSNLKAELVLSEVQRVLENAS